jgi:hypothetical protein
VTRVPEIQYTFLAIPGQRISRPKCLINLEAIGTKIACPIKVKVIELLGWLRGKSQGRANRQFIYEICISATDGEGYLSRSLTPTPIALLRGYQTTDLPARPKSEHSCLRIARVSDRCVVCTCSLWDHSGTPQRCDHWICRSNSLIPPTGASPIRSFK